jgi:hypothetical protein
VRLEELDKLKNLVTTLGIEPATFRIVPRVPRIIMEERFTTRTV